MAATNWLDAIPDTPEAPTLGDVGTAFISGMPATVGNMAGVFRWATEDSKLPGMQWVNKVATNVEQGSAAKAQEIIDYNMTTGGQKAFNAQVGSSDWWEHPVWSTLLQGSGSAASMIPVVMGPGLVETLIGTGLKLGTKVAIGAGVEGAISAGSASEAFHQSIDAMSDAELKDKSPLYKAYRTAGHLDETAARNKFMSTAEGYAPVAEWIIASAASLVGPSAMAIKALGGGSAAHLAGGVARRVLGAAGEGGASEFVQSWAEEMQRQNAMMVGGLQKGYDPAAMFQQALTGAVTGAAMAAPFGVLPHAPEGAGHVSPRNVKPEANVGAESTPPEQAATPSATPITPQAQPTAPAINYPNFEPTIQTPAQIPTPLGPQTVAPTDAGSTPGSSDVTSKVTAAPATPSTAPAPVTQTSARATITQVGDIGDAASLAAAAQVGKPATPVPSPVTAPIQANRATTARDLFTPAELTQMEQPAPVPVQGPQPVPGVPAQPTPQVTPTAPVAPAPVAPTATGQVPVQPTPVTAPITGGPNEPSFGGAPIAYTQEQIKKFNQQATEATPQPAPVTTPPEKLTKGQQLKLKNQQARTAKQAGLATFTSEVTKEPTAPLPKAPKAETAKKVSLRVPKEMGDQIIGRIRGIKGIPETVRVLKDLTAGERIKRLMQAVKEKKAAAQTLKQNTRAVAKVRNAKREAISEQAATVAERHLGKTYKTLKAEVAAVVSDAEKNIQKEKRATSSIWAKLPRETAPDYMYYLNAAKTLDKIFKRGGTPTQEQITNYNLIKEMSKARQFGELRTERSMSDVGKNVSYDETLPQGKITSANKSITTFREEANVTSEVKTGKVTKKGSAAALKALGEASKKNAKIAQEIAAEKQAIKKTPSQLEEEANKLLQEVSPVQKGPVNIYDIIHNRTTLLELEGRPPTEVEAEQNRLSILANARYSELPRLMKPSKSTLSEVLSHVLNPEWMRSLGPIARSVYPNIINRINASLRNDPVKVFYLPNEEFDILHGGEFQGSSGYFDWVNHSVVLKNDPMASTKFKSEILIHEALHAIFQRAIDTDYAIQDNIRSIMNEAGAVLVEKYGPELENASQAVQYAFTDVHEFVSVGLSSPAMMHELSNIKASSQLRDSIRELQRDYVATYDNSKTPSLWESLKNVFKSTLRSLLGLPQKQYSLIDALIDHASTIDIRAQAEGIKYKNIKTGSMTDRARGIYRPTVNEFMSSVSERAVAAKEGWWARNKLKVIDNATLARVAERIGMNMVRTITDTIEKIRIRADQYMKQSETFIRDMHAAEVKYKASGEFRNLADLMNDSTIAGVFPHVPLDQQEHLGKDRLDTVWSKGQYADLAARFNALPSELKKLYTQGLEFYHKQQDALTFDNIDTMIKTSLDTNTVDPSLVDRIMTDTTTSADATLLGPDLLKAIDDTSGYKRLKGPYFPLMRRGDHVVLGKYKITAPTAPHTVIAPNEFEFAGKDARKQAMSYAGTVDTFPTVKSVWVDATTGEEFVKEGAGWHKVEKQDNNAEQRFRVKVQDQHTEFHFTTMAANAAFKELQSDPNLYDVKREERFDYQGGVRPDLVSTQMQTLLNVLAKRDGFKALPKSAQDALKQALINGALTNLDNTRVRSHYKQRNRVSGASTDVLQNAYDYASGTSNYRAKLNYSYELNQALKAMDESGKNDYSNTSLSRSQIINQVHARISAKPYEAEPAWIRRALSTSFMGNLASPAYSIINALQPGMVALPHVAGRHGVSRSTRELIRAYRDIGAGAITKAGLKGSLKKVSDSYVMIADPVLAGIARLSGFDARAMQELLDRGSLEANQGIEMARTIRARNEGVGAKYDRALSYFESIARQMPLHIEAINRLTTGLMAFRMEMQRNGGNYDAAVQYAADAVNLTQGQYSESATAPLFKHPLMRLVFQFKKYGSMIYQLLGHHINNAINPLEPGDRADAIRALAYIAVAHTVMAGALGLPWEPFKVLVDTLTLAGVTKFNWSDIESEARIEMANLVGPTAGELMMRGVPRLLGFDISSRVGLQQLVGPFGDPQGDLSANNGVDDKAYLFDMISGAPVAEGWRIGKGVGQIFSGDYLKAAENLVPIKVFSNTIRAYRQATEGKSTAAGRQSLSPYSIPEAAARVLGFTPGREAEASDLSTYVARASQRYTQERSDWLKQYATASATDRYRMMGAINNWNASGAAGGAPLTLSELETYRRRRQNENPNNYVAGQLVARPTKNIFNRAVQTFGQ